MVDSLENLLSQTSYEFLQEQNGMVSCLAQHLSQDADLVAEWPNNVRGEGQNSLLSSRILASGFSLFLQKMSFVIHVGGFNPKLLQMRGRLCKRGCSCWLSLTVELVLFGEMYRAFHELLLSVPASSGLLLTNASLVMSRAYFMEPI